MKYLRLYVCFVIPFLAVLIVDAHAGKTPEQLVREARSQIKEVAISDVKKMIDSGEQVIILDVRDKEEFEKEHIAGAINISRGLLEFIVQDRIPDRDAKIVVY